VGKVWRRIVAAYCGGELQKLPNRLIGVGAYVIHIHTIIDRL